MVFERGNLRALKRGAARDGTRGHGAGGRPACKGAERHLSADRAVNAGLGSVQYGGSYAIHSSATTGYPINVYPGVYMNGPDWMTSFGKE